MAETIMMPKLGLDMTEGTFVNWVKKVGDQVKAGDVIAEIEADKATIEIESSASGVLTKQLVKVGDAVAVGAPIAEIGTEGAEQSNKDVPQRKVEAETEVKPKAETAPSDGNKAVTPVKPVESSVGDEFPAGAKASPIARRMAEEKGIDLRQVQGTGPGGRITKADVENFKPGAKPVPAGAPSGVQSWQPKPVPSGPGITVEPITKIRSIIAQRMTEAKQTVPHFYVTTEIDMGAAVVLRKQINEGLPEDQKISVNDLVVKAVALTLRQFPNLNSHYYGDKIVRHSYINIGIAVALDNGGLINVVAKDADVTSISRMAQRNKQMIANARAGKVRPEDIEGSTFTVSNLGPYDVEHFVAIINPPEAGILAVGSARQVPVVVNGELKIGTRMKCTLSVDHRISDGAEGAQFMQQLKLLLESPMRLLI